MNDEELKGWAAELTASAGVPDAFGDDTSDSETFGDDDGGVAEFEAYAADRDERLGLNDLERGGQQDDDQVDDGQHTGSSKRQVPLGALQQERAKRQQVQAELDAHRQQLSQLQAQQQWQLQQQAAQQQAEIPDFETDPQANIEARFQQLEQRQQAEAHQRQVGAQVDIIEREIAVTAPEVSRLEVEFSEQHTDYHDAFAHLNAELDARVRQQHPGASEAQHAMAKRCAMLMFAKDCQAKGLNPAGLIYAKAQELGFQARHSVPSTRNSGQRGSSGPSASRLSEMSDDEFNQLYADMQSKALVRPAFGGGQ